MEKVLIKLKEAAEIKSNISKQESLFWGAISEALASYAKFDNRFKENHTSAEQRSQTHAYMNTVQAAEYLGLKYGTLAGWRFYGTGPKYIRMGRAIRYSVIDLDEFANKNLASQAPPYPKR